MKVIQRGTLISRPDGALFVTGYCFDGEGACFDSKAEQDRAATKAALLELAAHHGIDLTAPDDTDLLDAAILSTNTIARAMSRAQEDVPAARVWWKFWRRAGC